MDGRIIYNNFIPLNCLLFPSETKRQSVHDHERFIGICPRYIYTVSWKLTVNQLQTKNILRWKTNSSVFARFILYEYLAIL